MITAPYTAQTAWAAEKASDLVGQEVVTPNGENVGRVVDLAIDITTGRLDFYVVSIGSFLIEDSLIAVDPNALVPNTRSAGFVIRTGNLTSAKRFNSDSWPGTADVLASLPQGSSEPLARDSSGSNPQTTLTPADSGGNSSERQANRTRATTGFGAAGSATITDGRRQATLADGKQEFARIERTPARGSASRPAENTPPAAFDKLDYNKDGRVSRREIGARLPNNLRYSDLDLDASGSIDSFEYEVFLDSLKR